jgi:hypothetical protein
MTGNEGNIQYRLDYAPGPLPPGFNPAPLLDAFGQCRARGLVGQDPTRYGGYAFGNISLRLGPGFVITGTQTGGSHSLTANQLAWVTDFDSAANRLRATGPMQPSSEAMSHGEVYRAAPGVGAVIHAHSPSLWHDAQWLGLPTTDPAAGYGTPAMAREVHALLATHPGAGVLAMGGHEDGIIAYAADMAQATHILFQALSSQREP